MFCLTAYVQRRTFLECSGVPLNKIKSNNIGQILIMDQDKPNGLALRAKENIKLPPSLEIIARELSDEGLKDSPQL
jgi:uracil DNA glycosylase